MDGMVKLKIEDSVLSVEPGTRLSAALEELKFGRKPVLARVDGVLRDLSFPVEADAEAVPVYPDDPEALDVLRHSASHLLAHAVLDLFPETKTGIGPAVETGFFYDFERATPFTPEDLQTIEARMKELVREDVPVERLVLPKRMLSAFPGARQELKVELSRKGEAQVTVYRQGPSSTSAWVPMSPRRLPGPYQASVSGAYWKGTEGPAAPADLQDRLPDPKSSTVIWPSSGKPQTRPSRLGPELDLFVLRELGEASPLAPKGARIRAIIEQYWRERHWAGGYDVLFTPHIGRSTLWEKSGHLGFYKDSMYAPLDIDGQEYYLKPMNCPFHIQIYKSRLRSYRDLPLRWAELGTVYRYERSGVLHGLLRVRGFTQDDAHIICTPGQIESEILRVLDFSVSASSVILASWTTRSTSPCATRNPAKYCGTDDKWCRAEASLVKALETRRLPYERMEGEAVFYGPKIDIKIKDALGRLWQCTTIQFDFNMSERFDMTFVGEDGREHRPFMVHRALFGSLERFFGLLIEHYKANFPLWLAPVQVAVLPIADRHEDYARELEEKLRAGGLRPWVDLSREKIGKKIRTAEVQKIPLILVVGDKEVERRTAALRVHGSGDKGEVALDAFIAQTLDFERRKALQLSY
jgi:threonyl-tRNA synthetase